jgi:hypothetical protein
MDEIFRMLGREHEADLARQAAKDARAALVGRTPRWRPRAWGLLSLRRRRRSETPAASPGVPLELARPILIRHSRRGDEVGLQRLAALDSRKLPKGSFLLGEVDGELVAAASLDIDEELLSDPFRPTANLRELLRLQAANVRRQRDALYRPAEAEPVRDLRRAA